MLVSKSKQIIFVQVPGTQCSQLTEIIAPYALDFEQDKELTPQSDRYSRFSESIPSLMRSNIDPKSYFKIVLVRNPYHRLIEIWQEYYKSPEDKIEPTFTNNLRFAFARQTGLNPFPTQEFQQMYPDGDFKSFVEFLDYILSKFNLDIARRYVGAADQYSYIENNLWAEFDYIVSYETLNVDIANLSEKFDLEATQLLLNEQERNEEEQKQFLEFYDEESLKTVNRLFIRDFVYFGYKQLSLFELNQTEQLKTFVP